MSQSTTNANTPQSTNTYLSPTPTDVTKIKFGDASLWREIFLSLSSLTNQPHLLTSHTTTLNGIINACLTLKKSFINTKFDNNLKLHSPYPIPHFRANLINLVGFPESLKWKYLLDEWYESGVDQLAHPPNGDEEKRQERILKCFVIVREWTSSMVKPLYEGKGARYLPHGDEQFVDLHSVAQALFEEIQIW
ncbi:hypothetical protein EJ08DRAFT_665266 [Tothia fuscella]|uniref:Uncharacterized protein n=1 Tax=Tothia fuscella TaxID=1048955 RepID=A0A9P4NH34_9PEZI|nr:hypothetical protein EJ08DRAFT_665266 [Tothia fuscella]